MKKSGADFQTAKVTPLLRSVGLIAAYMYPVT